LLKKTSKNDENVSKNDNKRKKTTINKDKEKEKRKRKLNRLKEERELTSNIFGSLPSPTLQQPLKGAGSASDIPPPLPPPSPPSDGDDEVGGEVDDLDYDVIEDDMSTLGNRTKPAWLDSDDDDSSSDGVGGVSLVSGGSRLRKLRKFSGEDVIGERELERRLQDRIRVQNEGVRRGFTDWAVVGDGGGGGGGRRGEEGVDSSDDEEVRSGEEQQRVSDGWSEATAKAQYHHIHVAYKLTLVGSALFSPIIQPPFLHRFAHRFSHLQLGETTLDDILKSTAPLTEANKSLPSGEITMVRGRDMNECEFNDSTVTVAKWHQSGEIFMTAGYDKTVRFFRSRGDRVGG